MFYTNARYECEWLPVGDVAFKSSIELHYCIELQSNRIKGSIELKSIHSSHKKQLTVSKHRRPRTFQSLHVCACAEKAECLIYNEPKATAVSKHQPCFF